MTAESWIWLALLAPLLWSTVNVLDKAILLRYNLTPLTYLALGGLVGTISLVVIGLGSTTVLALDNNTIVLAILSGFLYAIFTLLYFYGLQLSDVSAVAILTQTTPVFSLIWGVLLLGERYGESEYLGMGLVLLGACFAALSEEREEGGSGRLWATKTFLASAYVVAGAFALSISYLLQAVALKSTNTISVFFWQRASLVAISLALIWVRRDYFRRLPLAPVELASGIEVINLLALLSLTAALAAGPLSAVTFLASVQPVFVLILVGLLGFFGKASFLQSVRISRTKLIVSCSFVLAGLYLMMRPW
jgi:uncharacterized membrane protein